MKEAAQIAYEGYIKKTGGKSIATGQSLPTWGNLPQIIQEAWRASSRALIDWYKSEGFAIE